jgi:hypothetical protein
MRFTPLAVALASLAAAVPAYAQAPQTVGAPQTITDPAGEINGSTPPAAPVVMSGSTQLHHETTRPDRPRTPSQPRHATVPAADPPVTHTGPVAVRTPAPAAPTDPAPPARGAHATGRQLPFTGIAAWQIAAAGLALIALGYALWRVSPEP